jgi:hypothetical protein
MTFNEVVMNNAFKFFSKPDRFLLLLCFHAPAFAALTDGLVAYWSFDDCTAKVKS